MNSIDATIRALRLGRTMVLRDLSLQVPSGHWTAIVGPNGHGKSTLLRALAGLLPLDGEVKLLGRALRDWPARERARAVAWLGLDGESDAWTVRDVVMLGRLPHRDGFGPPSTIDEAAITRALDQTDTRALAARRMGTLSAGERQRVRLSRALAVQATILLMDEPVAHLDPPHQADWMALMRQLAQQGLTIISVLHDLNLALAADSVAVLQGGRVLAHGSGGDADVHRAIDTAFEGRVELSHVHGAWRAWLKA